MKARAILFLVHPVMAIGFSNNSAAQAINRVSVSSLGGQANGDCGGASASVDGRFVAFVSSASNLVPDDTNTSPDVFVHDRQTGETTRVNVDSSGAQAARFSLAAAISADGRYVAFDSAADNLVLGDLNQREDVFVHDQATGETTRVSVSSAGVGGNASSVLPTLSADGRFVAFESLADNLVAMDLSGTRELFVHDRENGETTRVSVDSSGNGVFNSHNGSISADGRWITFVTGQALVPDDMNLNVDIYVRDRVAGETTRVSVDSMGGEANNLCDSPSISADGRFVAFRSLASNLVTNDMNGSADVFVHDGLARETTRVSVDSMGVQGNGDSSVPNLSADGRLIAFSSQANNLVPMDTNGNADSFVHDRLTHETTRVSVNAMGSEGNDDSGACLISADGRYEAFNSAATNLVSNDTNLLIDVFVRDRGAVCGSGTVNAGAGSVVDVLRVNGETVLVAASTRTPIRVELASAPLGPNPARYVLWAWHGFATHPGMVTHSGMSLGCVVNPTPFQRLEQPQPLLCMKARGLPAAVCTGVAQTTGPATAPWTVTRVHGFLQPTVMTLQGLLEDSGASNSLHFSVTNAITVQIY